MFLPFRPMEPVMTEKLMLGDEYLYQIKWDGIRIVTIVENGKVRLFTRKMKPREQLYPEVSNILSNKFAKQTVILDGEIISIRNGKPDFFQVVKRDRMRDRHKIYAAIDRIPITYMLFDILYWKDRWLWDTPLCKRQQLLEEAVVAEEQLQITPSIEDGEGLWNWTKERGWEGIVIKEKLGCYRPGEKHPTWRKLKNFQELESIVLGVTLKAGKVYSLLLGLPKNEGRYQYIGRVSSGLNQEEIQLLTEYSKLLAVKDHVTVIGMPRFREEEIRWFAPTIRVKVRFLEWSPDGVMRSPVILQFLH
jgi:bifunctional non-homologous end joining protein LigD